MAGTIHRTDISLKRIYGNIQAILTPYNLS